MQILFDEVMRDSRAHPDRSLSIAEWIPSKTKARIKLLPSGINAGLAGKTRIARIGESRGSIGHSRAPLASIKISQIEVVDIALREGHPEER